jgi:glycosyltransferase involved in cell wall biosynthesis
MSAANPAITVVTPFFDTEGYLGECIESVLAQTRTDFEYVLLDNHSTDSSAAIAEKFARRDKRIRLIRTPQFLDQVSNYNHALTLLSPSTQFVKIVQADDWIYPNCLAEMTALGEMHPECAIISSYDIKGTDVRGSGLPPDRRVITGREACRLHLLEGTYMFGSPTTLLFRADIVRARRPFYEQGRFHEDTEAVYEILRDNIFGFVPQILSYSRVHQQSITGAARRYDPNQLDRLILVKRYGRDFLNDKEFEWALDIAETRYYRCLARAALGRRHEGYWDYHRRGLATIGESIDMKRVAARAVPILLDWAVTPKKAFRALKARLAGQEGPPQGQPD